MKIGYARVSTQEQNEALQLDALRGAGCEKLFSDTISGAKFERKGLDEALTFLRARRYPGGLETGSRRSFIETPD